MRAALIKDGLVENVIEYDPNQNYEPEEGFVIRPIEQEEVGPGWTLDGDLFIEPPTPEPQEPIEAPKTPEQKRIEALEAAVDQLILDQLMGG